MNVRCITSGVGVTVKHNGFQFTLQDVLGILKRSSIAGKKLCDITDSEFIAAFDNTPGKTLVPCSSSTLELPQSLLPVHDCPAERFHVVTDASGMRVHIPDRYYERGWNTGDGAFYFPLAGKYDRATLKELLRILCNREQDCDILCTKNKFRSGCLLTLQDGFTVEQLEQFRKAARIILYGFGRHHNALHYPLDNLGSAVACYINHTTVLQRVLEVYYGQDAWGSKYRSDGDSMRKFDLCLAKSEKLTAYALSQRLASTENIWVPVFRKECVSNNYD